MTSGATAVRADGLSTYSTTYSIELKDRQHPADTDTCWQIRMSGNQRWLLCPQLDTAGSCRVDYTMQSASFTICLSAHLLGRRPRRQVD